MEKDTTRYFDYISNANDQTVNTYIRSAYSKLNRRANASLSEVERAVLDYYKISIKKRDGVSGASLYYRGINVMSLVNWRDSANIVDSLRKFEERRNGIRYAYSNAMRSLHWEDKESSVWVMFSADNERFIDKERAVENYNLNAKYREVKRILRQKKQLSEHIHYLRERFQDDMNDTKHNICMCNADLHKLIYGGIA